MCSFCYIDIGKAERSVAILTQAETNSRVIIRYLKIANISAVYRRWVVYGLYRNMVSNTLAIRATFIAYNLYHASSFGGSGIVIQWVTSSAHPIPCLTHLLLILL